LKNLDVSNPKIANPRSFGSLSSLISLMSGALGLVLVMGATPGMHLENNPLAIFCCLIILLGAMYFLIPRVMSWDWQSRYFGATSLHLAALTFLCIIPLLCLVFYSRVPLAFRLLLLGASVIVHAWWAHRFVLLYREIFGEKRLFSLMYYEVGENTYYMQNVDKYLIENIFKFRQMPADRYLIGFLAIGIVMLFFAERVNSLTGLPFVHSFLAVSTVPVSLMLVGLVTRGWLIFYLYPAKIYKLNGRKVYVDMVDFPDDFKKTMSDWKRAFKNDKLD